MEHQIGNNTFILGCEKEMFWKESSTLIISDVHLGKIQHFNDNGIRIPAIANENNYWRISNLLDKYPCSRVIFLGDLFHSVYNSDWEQFSDFVGNYSNIDWVLVKGNHDILEESAYSKAQIAVVEEIKERGILFTHEPLEVCSDDLYNLCGHIHPAVRMRGDALQSVRLSCFYFGSNQGIAPAFGEFTGSHTIKPKKDDVVYVITKGEVIRVS